MGRKKNLRKILTEKSCFNVIKTKCGTDHCSAFEFSCPCFVTEEVYKYIYMNLRKKLSHDFDY